ncbi:LOW QUALITY PROTEIN: cyclic nucleotide-gated cation channel alpha-3 [Plakobranchus ocellatus]|uniref:Cyclic nucleotide-gated cation channel alpha-3 n=1 Tax=Plakobranchus ocellatus TaxID=259542 RepID=A0AAV4DXE4_9GAST|nr:LOW QUALITY PROTEIN: cyclic nucleotide-gated cation channel alpha-3 [Plakobranchus ocellatus]
MASQVDDLSGHVRSAEQTKTWGRRGGRQAGREGARQELGERGRGEYSGGEGSLPRRTTSNNNEHYNAIRVDDEEEDLFDSRHDLDDRIQHPYEYHHHHHYQHHHHADCDDIDNIDYADPSERRPDGGASHAPQTPSSLPVVTANGPRNFPPGSIFTSQQASSSVERDKLIGERLSSSDKISLSSPIYSNKVVDQQKAKSTSKQSLLDLFSSRLDRVKATRKRFSLAQTSLMKKPRPSDGNIIAAVTTRNQRRQRRKEIKRDFGKKSLIRGGHGVLGDVGKVDSGRPPGHSQGVGGASTSSDREGCNWTFVFDPSGRLCYWWSSVVSVAFLYNFWVIIYRFAFQEIDNDNIAVWFTLDYTADFLYFLDIAFHFRTGYLEDGVLQTDPTKLRIHYTNTTVFYIDCLCLLPIDFLYLSIGFCSIVRGFRLVKVYRFWSFLDRTERHTNYPNVIRTATLLHYLLALFHWNACLYFLVASRMDKVPPSWVFPKDKNDTLLQYLHALYWSVLTLTTIGDPPSPQSLPEYLFVIFELLFALLLFATVLGHIANIVTNVSAARKEFQGCQGGTPGRRIPVT